MHQIFYVTVDPERALGIEDLIPSYHIVHSLKSQLTDPIGDSGIDIKRFDINSETGTSKILENESVQKYISKNAHGTADILVFKNDKKIEELSERLGYRLLNPKNTISKRFENKLEFSEFIKEIDIFKKPLYETFESLSDLKYESLSQKIHHEVVVQFIFGHSGNSTFYIKNEEQLEELKSKFPLRKGKVAKKIDGIPYTINACITSLGIVIGGISEQITGIEELTSSLGGTVGNDFTQRHLDDESRKNLIERTMRFGELLKKEGHNGLFGLDLVFVPEEKEFYIIECNARQTMSCGYVSYLQRMNQQVPIMLWHSLELIGYDYSNDFLCLDEIAEPWINKGIKDFKSSDQLEYNIKNNQPLLASQVFFRNIQDYDVKVLDPFPTGTFRMRGRTPNESADLEDNTEYPVIFRLREDGWSSLCFVKRSYNILQAQEDGGFLITAAAEGTIVPPLGELGRLQILGSAFSSPTSDDLNGWIQDSIKAIYENMRLMKNENPTVAIEA
jgi:hypothetical protein